MKVALVTTPASVRSGIGDYTRHLLPYLREHCDVDVYAAPITGSDGPVRPASELRPEQYDQILYQLGNEIAHAFMLPMVRAHGGTVVQHDWVLFDMVVAARPTLARGGFPGLYAAMREGGLSQARTYLDNWRARRDAKRGRVEPLEAANGASARLLLAGWHGVEPSGRWTADTATFRLPVHRAARIRVVACGVRDRTVTLRQRSGALSHAVRFDADGERELALDLGESAGVFAIDTVPVTRTAAQEKNGDPRRLGAFVRRIAYEDASGVHEVDLAGPVETAVQALDLSRDRFRLPLNRSIVRFADAFIVHSLSMKRRILEERNAATPVCVVHHGAERRWRDEPRDVTRARLGLPDAWQRGFLVVSFGNLQRHKRIEQLLHAVRDASRARARLRLVLVGQPQPEDCDVARIVDDLGIADRVRITGYLPEEICHDYLHAADVCVNLRGPSTGGTSGGAFQAMSFGRAVIASDDGEQSELPSACVIKVPTDDREVPILSGALIELCDDAAKLRYLEEAARAFVERECHWSVVARRYAESLEQFPQPKARRKRVFALPTRMA